MAVGEGRAPNGVPVASKLVFRREALREYQRGRGEIVLPRLATPRALRALWLLPLLLLGALGALALAPVRAYAPGAAVEVLQERVTPRAEGTVVVAFFPAQQLGRLAPGAAIIIPATAGAPLASGTIISVEPGILGAAAAAERFGLSGDSAALAIQEPAVCVVASFPSLPAAGASAGKVHRVIAEAGAQRLADLIPFLAEIAGARKG